MKIEKLLEKKVKAGDTDALKIIYEKILSNDERNLHQYHKRGRGHDK